MELFLAVPEEQNFKFKFVFYFFSLTAMIYRLVANAVEDWAPQVGMATSILLIFNSV
jgi:hypothetical protein